MVTLKELDGLVNTVVRLGEELKRQLHPNGKPDWMTEEQWGNICKLSNETEGISKDKVAEK